MNITFYFKTTVSLVCAIFLVCCSYKPSSASDSKEKAADSVIAFRHPIVPDVLKDQTERRVYLAEHYWDHFDFHDTLLIHKPDVSEQAFVDYIVLLNNLSAETAKESIEILIRRASQNWDMQNFIIDLFGRYLYDPNSPYRNEELYIPFLEIVTKSPTARTADVETGKFRLKMAFKNRPGAVAADFVYGDRNGQLKKLSSIQSEYVLLFFYDPDCETCHRMMETLTFSPLSNDHRLKILTIYPDDDINSWRKRIIDFPAHWINGYSPGGKIVRENLYDVKAMPTFYLLGKDKKVILKDVPLVYVLEYLNSIL